MLSKLNVVAVSVVVVLTTMLAMFFGYNHLIVHLYEQQLFLFLTCGSDSNTIGTGLDWTVDHALPQMKNLPNGGRLYIDLQFSEKLINNLFPFDFITLFSRF